MIAGYGCHVTGEVFGLHLAEIFRDTRKFFAAVVVIEPFGA